MQRAELLPAFLPGFSADDIADTADAFAVPDVGTACAARRGNVWLLGNHRLMCGDSTSADDVAKLMRGNKASMVFADPPYGMGKEADGVIGDNMNSADILGFNGKWIPLSFSATKDNGSWYCWGTDEPLMDVYSTIIKPMIATQKVTFRNLITWAKGNGQGQNESSWRSYAIADEKCLFVMCGVQGFSTNADNYWDGWEPIRSYLAAEMTRASWTNADINRITGTKMASHWVTKSQWVLLTREHYETIQFAAREYDAFRREYDELRREYDELKREYYATRAYFDNTHDNFNNVWELGRHIRNGSEGGHATPKPIALCERAIKSSSKLGDIVFDPFGGCGSTLIACEKNGRENYSMEISERFCDVIVQRWQGYTGKTASLEVEPAANLVGAP